MLRTSERTAASTAAAGTGHRALHAGHTQGRGVGGSRNRFTHPLHTGRYTQLCLAVDDGENPAPLTAQLRCDRTPHARRSTNTLSLDPDAQKTCPMHRRRRQLAARHISIVTFDIVELDCSIGPKMRAALFAGEYVLLGMVTATTLCFPSCASWPFIVVSNRLSYRVACYFGRLLCSFVCCDAACCRWPKLARHVVTPLGR